MLIDSAGAVDVFEIVAEFGRAPESKIRDLEIRVVHAHVPCAVDKITIEELGSNRVVMDVALRQLPEAGNYQRVVDHRPYVSVDQVAARHVLKNVVAHAIENERV